MPNLILVAIAWLLYGILHSLLAGNGMKQWVAAHWPKTTPLYRLGFNIAAGLLLLPPLWLTYRDPGAAIWVVPSWISWPALVVAVGGFMWSMRWYDGATFLGLRQWRDHVGPDDEYEAFRISPVHRHVRHPWYALGLLFLWTRDLNAAWLVAAAAITIYLIIGSRLEENKLIALYGDAYRRYRDRVPALLPLPWRSLSTDEARELQTLAHAEVAAQHKR
jgi:protein-S-isoprenylcysteine O-methyltransferase Ste14